MEATKIVVPQAFEHRDNTFEYAAASRVVRIEAGEYPLKYVTIQHREPTAPVHYDNGPYYAVAELPCETLSAVHCGEVTTHWFRDYQYRAKPGEVALVDRNYQPAAYYA